VELVHFEVKRRKNYRIPGSKTLTLEFASEKTYLEEGWRLGTWNSVILASFYFEMYKFHDEIPIRT
jgi:hypothetical protein